jgi:glycosyltransferase involved in cell wall biosynthesis
MKIAASSFVAAVSSYGRSQLMRWAPPEEWNKLHVVHCGLDKAYMAQPAPRNPSHILLCVGRYSEQKGHILLIDAAAMLRDRGASFQIRLAGDGPLRPVMERRIRENGLSSHVVLLGALSQPAIREEIRQAHAFVLPSFAEGLPVALMESMALSTPVISTYIAGIPELVQPEHGWLIPAGDPEALCNAMQHALGTDPATIASMGAKARNRALAHHDIATSALLLERHMMRSPPGPVVMTQRPSCLTWD